MTDRRILTLRCILLTAAALLLSLVRPDWALYLFASFAWMPLGLFSPAFAPPASACSGSCTIEATSCSITFSGVVVGSGAGPCDACVSNPWNTTFVVPRDSACSGFISIGQNCVTGKYDLLDWSFSGFGDPDDYFQVRAIVGADAATLPTATLEHAILLEIVSAPVADCRTLVLNPTLRADRGFNCATGTAVPPASIINFDSATCTAVMS